MIYLILNYEIQIWEDDHEFLTKNGCASRIQYPVEEDLFCNTDDALDTAREYLETQNQKPIGDKSVIVAVSYTMTATSYYDAYNGEHDVKYELITSDVIIFGEEEENNETFQFL
jgi:hypothetical protein